MSQEQTNLFRALPSVDQALDALAQSAALGVAPELQLIPRSLQKDYINLFLEQCRAKIREQIRDGQPSDTNALGMEAILTALRGFVLRKGRPHFRRVVNATGVVIHTNLGRSILADEACKAVDLACRHYSNLEFDLENGERGSRYSHVVEIMRKLTGAESALVVNNNAAAVLLVMDSLCKGREVVVSRGELVEIGGSFRIPEVIERSGCLLREVGATNRTHLADFEKALGPESAAILKVHTSNFRIVGFHSQPEMADLAKLAQKHDVPLINDLGSGSFCDFSDLSSIEGLARLDDEPTVQQAVAAGADVITFSGDKVLGGPQAGIIIGKEKYLAQIRKNPLNRALRIDKMTLAALEATLRLYADPKLALKRIPTLTMITATPEQLKRKAQRLAKGLLQSLTQASNQSREGTAEASAPETHIHCVPGASRVGGGAFPERDLPTTLVRIRSGHISATELKQHLLQAEVPIIGRIEDQAFSLDPRTLTEADYPIIFKTMTSILR